MVDEATPDSASVLYPDDVPKSERPAAPSAKGRGTGAPDSDYSVEMSEGLEMTGEIMAEITPTFRELNLSSTGVQKLMPHAAAFRDRVIDG